MPPSPLPAFMARGDEIQRRADLSPGAFASESLFPGTPVILTDTLRRWPALDKWTLEALAERFHDREVPFK